MSGDDDLDARPYDLRPAPDGSSLAIVFNRGPPSEVTVTMDAAGYEDFAVQFHEAFATCCMRRDAHLLAVQDADALGRLLATGKTVGHFRCEPIHDGETVRLTLGSRGEEQAYFLSRDGYEKLFGKLQEIVAQCHARHSSARN